MLAKLPPRPVVDAENPLARAQYAERALAETWILETLRDAALARGVPKDKVALLFDGAARSFHELFAAAGADFARAERGGGG